MKPSTKVGGASQKVTDTIRKTRLTSQKVAELIAGFASDKKAEDIVILDMRKIVNFCDYFVICTGESDRRIRAIIDSIVEGLARHGVHATHIVGYQDARWAIADYGDVVAHVFDKETREFYGLEHLWQEAPRISFPIP